LATTSRVASAGYCTGYFSASANTDPKGDRSKRPRDQDPNMIVHVVKETGAGIVLRAAKYETATSYADQAFLNRQSPSWVSRSRSLTIIRNLLSLA
jgi:4-hydroxyphenylacetate 3-monooxygenase